MADSIFHKDFKTMPWWWEWWHPSNELSQDPPLKTDVLVVGAGYGGLSTALELARSGIDVTVLERGDFGVGASTRNGGGVSGGTTMGKGFSGKGVGGDPEAWKQIMQRMLAEIGVALLERKMGVDLSGCDVDGPLPKIPASAVLSSRVDQMVEAGSWVVGTPDDLVEFIRALEQRTGGFGPNTASSTKTTIEATVPSATGKPNAQAERPC